MQALINAKPQTKVPCIETQRVKKELQTGNLQPRSLECPSKSSIMS